MQHTLLTTWFLFFIYLFYLGGWVGVRWGWGWGGVGVGGGWGWGGGVGGGGGGWGGGWGGGSKIHFLADIQSLVNFLHELQSWFIYCYDINIIKNSAIVGIDRGNVIIFMKAYLEFLCTHHFNECCNQRGCARILMLWNHQLDIICYMAEQIYSSGLILGLYPANERYRYKVMPSLIGWAQS